MPKFSSRIAFVVGLLLALAMAVSVVKDFESFPGHADRLPTWDPSAHGFDGIMLADAVKAVNPIAFFKAIYLMSYWPPVFPLLEVPGFVLRGYDFHVARDTVAALYVLTVLAAFAAGFFLTESLGFVTGVTAAALVASSPFFKLFANIEMAEIPSALFQLTCVASFFAYEAKGSRRALIGFCVSLSLLFFTKYNNGLLVMIALMFFHWFADPVGRRELLATLKTYFSTGAWRRPFWLFAAVYLVALAGVFLAGGISFDAFGKKVFVRTVGNPLYVLMLLMVLRWATTSRGEALHLIALLRRVTDPYRSYLLWVIAPILVWMVNPNNLRTFFLVVTNEAPDEKRPLLVRLFYYPRVILDDYVGSPSIGIAVFLFAALPLLWIRKLTNGQKFLYLFGLLSLFLCAVHQNQTPRYVFPIVPLIFLGAAFALSRPLVFLSRQNKLIASSIMTAIVLAAFWQSGRSTEATAREFEKTTTTPGLTPVIDFICGEAKQSKGDTTLIGFWDELSPGVVQWTCRQPKNDVSMDQIPKTPNRLGLDFYAPDVEKFLAQDDLKTIFVANYRTDPPQPYLMHYRNARLLPLVEQLEKDPRFTKANVKSFEQPWYQIAVYRRR